MKVIFTDIVLKGRGVQGEELFIADNAASFTVDDEQQYAAVQLALTDALKQLGIAASLSKAGK